MSMRNVAVVSSGLVRSRRWVAVLATLGCLALVGGCMFGGGTDDDRSDGSHKSPSCGLLSSDSLNELTGGTPVSTGGRMVSHEVRASNGLDCVVYDAATGKTILQISVNDTSERNTFAAIRKVVLKDRKSIPHCVRRATLPHNGFFCAQADQTLTAAALPKRLVRLTATRDARTRLTADNASRLMDEVSSRVDRYDASQS